MHDETVDRTTNGTGRVNQMTYDKIAELDAGEGEIVPTLEEVIDLCRGKCRLNVEIKGTAAAKRAAEIIKEKGFVKDVLVQSNYIESLLAAKKVDKNIETALLYWAAKSGFGQRLVIILSLILLPLTKMLIKSRAKKAQVAQVSINYYLATSRMIQSLQKAGLKINVWTVNEPDKIKKFKDLKVDGIISNYPDRI